MCPPIASADGRSVLVAFAARIGSGMLGVGGEVVSFYAAFCLNGRSHRTFVRRSIQLVDEPDGVLHT
jgi:hypothetical protein